MNCCISSSGRSRPARLTSARISSGVEAGRWVRSSGIDRLRRLTANDIGSPRPRPAQEERSAQLHLDFVALDAHGIGLQVIDAGRGGGLAGLDVEAPGMQRAFDFALFHPAVGKLGVGVGADVVGRVERAVHLVESDFVTGDNHADHLAVAERGTLRRLYPTVIRHAKPRIVWSHPAVASDENALNAMIVNVSLIPGKT